MQNLKINSPFFAGKMLSCIFKTALLILKCTAYFSFTLKTVTVTQTNSYVMQKLFKDYGKIFVRTPMYSYTSLFTAPNETKNLDDLVHFRLHDPVFLEALYWSSPQLFEAVLKFKEGEVKGVREEKLMQTLKKYLIRASTRCTPYGIYAGTAITDIGIQQENQNSAMERKVRIDMGFLQSLKSAIESDPAVYPHLFYSLNNSLYRIPGQYRFIETIIENGACYYQLSSLEYSEFLEKIIALAFKGDEDTTHGRVNSKSLMLSLDNIYHLAENDTPKEAFNDFARELIKSQFLVSELQIGLTGGEDLERYVRIMKGLMRKGVQEAKKYLLLFTSIEHILNWFQMAPIGNLPIQEIKDLKTLLNESGIASPEHLFHADLRQSINDDFVFTKQQVKEIEQGIIALGKISCNPSPQQADINRFKKLFLEKYGTRDIPLCEALDPEFGIGFPANERIGDAGFNSFTEKVNTSQSTQKQVAENYKALLQNKGEEMNHDHLNESIEINEEDLKELTDRISDLPVTFSVMGHLLPGGKILLEDVGGAPANALAGRFAYLDKDMLEVCEEISATERHMNKEVVFAEIIFIPEGRIANIARRPVLSEYEIPLLARPSAEENQIPVNDLLVSVQDNEIILRSGKLHQRVIPRLSNAHNFSNSLVPAYKFLGALQQQGKYSFGIGRADSESNKHFLPRIVYRNIIFRRRCWFLYKSDISTIVKAGDPMKELSSFFLKWHVPRFICFAESDNELFIDTHINDYLSLLVSEIKTRNTVKLIEWVYETSSDEDQKEKPTIKQFILPFAQTNPPGIPSFGKSETTEQLERKFEPGSEWVYFKIYCGAVVSDKILLNVVKPAIERLSAQGVITEAFFIRFTDPHYHIRFRLHLASQQNNEPLATAMKCIYDLLHPFCESSLVWKVQLDTYDREIERYGASNIATSEFIFSQDSLLLLDCLKDAEFSEDEQIRFFAALKNIDKWLTLFKMSVEEKAAFCLTTCNSFLNEYKPDIKIQTDIKYRQLKNLYPGFLSSEKFDPAFRERDKNIRNIGLAKENLASYIHMSLNRWFVNQQRLMEYMCYSFCGKYYLEILHTTNNIITVH
jgi:lantibiotic biosynthesis protein